jgi:fumarate reductase (CoM/CoB) subunit A
MYDVIDTGVLIVGGGGAGCRAAIEAHDQGVDVLMIVKGRLGHSGCTLNVGTSAAVGPWGVPEDTTDLAMRDLLAHGGYLGNQEMVKVLAEESPDRIVELQDWGIDFERNEDGSIAINRSAEHTHPRNFAFKPTGTSHHDHGYPPGIALMDVLMGEMAKRSIRVMDDVALVDLLVTDGRVVGATAIDCNANKLVVFRARATVLATGTYSQVYSHTTVSPQETGDGQAAAYRAGAELIDMENTQFVATSTGYPPGSVFLNAKGESFLENYGIPSTQGVSKEALIFAVGTEIKEGRATERGTILIDMSSLDREGEWAVRHLSRFEENLRNRGSVYPGHETKGVDYTKEPFETSPLAHTATGGVRVNERCETSLPGLYAAGAVAGGVYGHARPEGYTSMITLVFGRIAGLVAAQDSQETGDVALDDTAVQASIQWAAGLAENSAGMSPDEIKTQIRATMKDHAWIIKDEDGMKAGLERIREIREIERLRAESSEFSARPRDGFAWTSAVEVPNMLLASELMLMGGIERKESRGAFFRADYPETDDDNWLKNLIYKQADSGPVIETARVDLKYFGPSSKSAVAAT